MERDVLVVGESLVDIVHAADGRHVEYAGGSAANVAVALARLGRSVRFATAFADDDRGRLIAEHLDAPGSCWRRSRARVGADLDGGGHHRRGRRASYEFDLEWRLNPVAAERAAFVHTCSLGAVLEPGGRRRLRAAQRLREARP